MSGDHKIKLRSNVKIKGNKEKFLHYMSRPKNNLNLTKTLKIAYFLPHKAKKKMTHKLDKIKSKN